MTSEPEEIIETIKKLKNRIEQMDDRVKRYLSDRKRYPHPGHETLIEEIHRFENRIHNLKNSDIQFWLEGLLHSLMVHQRIWRSAFEKDGSSYSEKPRRGGAVENSYQEGEEDIPIDKLYTAAKRTWDQLGVERKMSKKELLEKVRPEYRTAKKNLKEGEKISWSINRKTNEVQIKVTK